MWCRALGERVRTPLGVQSVALASTYSTGSASSVIIKSINQMDYRNNNAVNSYIDRNQWKQIRGLEVKKKIQADYKYEKYVSDFMSLD